MSEESLRTLVAGLRSELAKTHDSDADAREGLHSLAREVEAVLQSPARKLGGSGTLIARSSRRPCERARSVTPESSRGPSATSSTPWPSTTSSVPESMDRGLQCRVANTAPPTPRMCARTSRSGERYSSMSEPSRPGAHWGALALLLGGTGGAALIAAIASVRAADFYQLLSKPAWAPPAQVSARSGAPSMCSWRWRRGLCFARVAGPALGRQSPSTRSSWCWKRALDLALLSMARGVDCICGDPRALGIFLLFTASEFWRARRLAGSLLLPYLVWVTFAVALTYAIWRRNPGVL